MDLNVHTQSIQSFFLEPIISQSKACYWIPMSTIVNLKHAIGSQRPYLLSESLHMDLEMHSQFFYEIFSKHGSPGQTAMLTRRALKFRVKPQFPFSEISHHYPKNIGKPSNIVSWPVCRPERPSDSSGDGGVPTVLPIQQGLGAIKHRNQIFFSCGIPLLISEGFNSKIYTLHFCTDLYIPLE